MKKPENGRGHLHWKSLRPFVDVLMLALLLALTAYAYLAGALHEAAGLGFLVVIGVHLGLSFRQSGGNWLRPFSWMRSACRLVELILLADIVNLGVSGIALAPSLFVFPFPVLRPSLARSLHRVLAHSALMLAGIHLGLRIPVLLGLVGIRRQRSSRQRPRGIALTAVLGLVAAYGLVAAVRRDYFRIDLDTHLMMFANTEEPLAFFILDHGAILVLALTIGRLLRRGLRLGDKLNTPKETQP